MLGRPCIEYVINSLASAGVEEIFIACGYRSQDIVNSLGDTTRYGAKITYAYEEVPMGTAGAVKLLQDKLHGTFLVGSGDTLTDADLGHLIDFRARELGIPPIALVLNEDDDAQFLSPREIGEPAEEPTRYLAAISMRRFVQHLNRKPVVRQKGTQ